jgi:hypothetical protein
MIEFISEKLPVKIDGVVYELSYPTVSTVRKFEKQEGEAGVKEVCEFLCDSGLPLNVVEALQANHMSQLVQALMGKLKA